MRSPAESEDDNANAPEDASEDDVNASTDNSSENGSAKLLKVSMKIQLHQ